MRSWGSWFVLSLLSCGGPSTSSTEGLPPAGSAWLKFDDLFHAACDPGLCPGATRVIVAGATDVAMSHSGDETLVGLTVQAWWLFVDCTDPAACVSTWKTKPLPACYSVKGTTVTPASGCPTAAPTLAASAVTPWLGSAMDPLSPSHSVMRAFFGVQNADPLMTVGSGRGSATRWWGDLTVPSNSLDEYWGVSQEAFGGVPTPMLAVFDTSQASPVLEYLVPAPDARPFTARTAANVADPVYWSDRSDTVLALNVTDTRVMARRVRKPITSPQTSTVGVLEAGDQVFTLVLSPSSTTLSGASGGPVYEASLVTSGKLSESEAPLQPFAPIAVHTPNSVTMVICFSEPLDDGALSASQFSSDSALTFSSVANDVVPQCARLVTSPQSREQRYHVTVKGVTSRSGTVLSEAVVSATPDDEARGSPISRVPDLGLPRSSYLPTPAGYLAANGPVFGALDLGGVVFHHLETGAPVMPVGNSVLRADPAAGGLWVNYGTAAGVGVLQLDEPGGTVTTWTQADLPSVLLFNSGFAEPVGDGSVLLYPRTGAGLVRLRKGGLGEQLTQVTTASFRGLERRSHQVLVEDAIAHRLNLITLPATVGSTTFAIPSSSLSVANGPACETQGVVYWCTGLELFRLGDVATPSLGRCRDLTADPSGDCWATSDLGALTRVRGMALTPVTLSNPFDGGVVGHPEFVGDTVFLDERTLRMPAADWATLAGSVP